VNQFTHFPADATPPLGGRTEKFVFRNIRDVRVIGGSAGSKKLSKKVKKSLSAPDAFQ